MKKALGLISSLLLSTTICSKQGPIAREFKKLEKGGGTTTEFIATVDGRAEQVAQELDCVRLSLDAYKSEGSLDAWHPTHRTLTNLTQLAQEGDTHWVEGMAAFMREIPNLSDPDSNIHGNMQIMFEVGKKQKKALPENATICAPERANYIAVELELIPVRTDQINIESWTKTVNTLIGLIKKISNDSYMKEHATEVVEELGQLLVACQSSPDSGVRLQVNTKFYDTTPTA